VVTYLVDKLGFDVGAENQESQSVLYAAACSGHFDIVKLLVKMGADPAAPYEGYGDSPLGCAARSGSLENVNFLVEKGADVTAADGEGWTALHAAVEGGSLAVVAYLVEKGANVNASRCDDACCTCVLEGAVKKGRLDLVKFLTGKGADPGPGGGCENLLEAAKASGSQAMVKYLEPLLAAKKPPKQEKGAQSPVQ
jgi:ankyrin repeat protein